MSTDRRQTDERQLAIWLREQGLVLLATIASTLAAGAYLAGHSWIEGWNEAAGISELAFSRDTTDLIARGVTDSSAWGLIGMVLAGAALYFLVVHLIASGLRHLWHFTTRPLGIGKRPDKGRPTASPADTLVDGPVSVTVALEPGILGSSAAETKPASTSASSRSANGDQVGWTLGVIFCVAVLFGIYLFVDVTLHKNARSRGAFTYRDVYLAATDKPFRNQTIARQTLDEYRSHGQQLLQLYPIALVERIKDDGTAQKVECGYLLQEQSERLLLLNKNGQTMLNFGDGAYMWHEATVSDCPDVLAKPATGSDRSISTKAAAETPVPSVRASSASTPQPASGY